MKTSPDLIIGYWIERGEGILFPFSHITRKQAKGDIMVRKELDRWVENGVRMVAVPLGAKGERRAELSEDDWNTLVRMGVSESWHYGAGGYVQASAHRARGKQISPARCLFACGPGQRIKYRDGNPLNMRRNNMEVTAGGYSIKRDIDFITPAATRLSRR